jgi:hypothetical protein
MPKNTILDSVFSILKINASFFTLLSFIALVNVLIAQQNSFTGMLEYKINPRDSAMKDLIPENVMIIYTNDTIARMENQTSQLGKQIVIRHMEKNKSYLLLDTKLGKFAIQTDPSKADTIAVESKYNFKNKFCRTKILGKKANRVVVSHPSFEEKIEFLYFKDISNKYNNVFKEVQGLPVKYSIPSADGVLDYELVRINRFMPNHDLFGIPSDYERLSFDEFLDKMLAPENEKLISPE